MLPVSSIRMDGQVVHHWLFFIRGLKLLDTPNAPLGMLSEGQIFELRIIV